MTVRWERIGPWFEPVSDEEIEVAKKVQAEFEAHAEAEAKAKAEKAAAEEKAKAEKAAAEAKAKAEKAAAEKAAEAARQQALQDALQAEEDERAAAAQSSADEAAIADFVARITAKVTGFFVYPDLKPGLSCELRVKIAPDGQVLEAQVVRSSGDPAFDRQAERAVQKASPLPVPTEARVFDKMRDIRFVFEPEG